MYMLLLQLKNKSSFGAHMRLSSVDRLQRDYLVLLLALFHKVLQTSVVSAPLLDAPV